jgi:hypothetical protein
VTLYAGCIELFTEVSELFRLAVFQLFVICDMMPWSASFRRQNPFNLEGDKLGL